MKGTWALSLSGHQTKPSFRLSAIADATLTVASTTRTNWEGTLKIGKEKAKVRGRLRPGSPTVITLDEVNGSGEAISDGIGAILYAAPRWPNVDYTEDLVYGTLVVGGNSAFSDSSLCGRLISIAGSKPY
ncbi:MAG: hypothetical protein WAU68_03850 [Vitreimonas sp.]